MDESDQPSGPSWGFFSFLFEGAVAAFVGFVVSLGVRQLQTRKPADPEQSGKLIRQVDSTDSSKSTPVFIQTSSDQGPVQRREPEQNGQLTSFQSAQEARSLGSPPMDDFMSQVDLHVDTQDLPGNCLQKLQLITDLEKSCMRLSSECEKTAVELIELSGPMYEEANQDETDTAPALTSGQLDRTGVSDRQKAAQQAHRQIQDTLLAFRSKWAYIRRLYYCIDTHMRNASDYHQFYSELEACHQHMELSLEQAQTQMDILPLIPSEQDHAQMGEDVKALSKIMKDLQKMFIMIDMKAASLVERSYNIVPLPVRTTPVVSPVAARALCSFKDDQTSVTEGEPIVILSNSDTDRWEIEDSNGRQVSLPSVCCLIPAPDKTAVDAAQKLREELIDNWTKFRDTCYRRLVLWFRAFLLVNTTMKAHCFKVTKPDHLKLLNAVKEQIEDQINRLHILPQRYQDELAKLTEEYHNILGKAETEGVEDDKMPRIMQQNEMLKDLLEKFKTIMDSWENAVAIKTGPSPEHCTVTVADWPENDMIIASIKDGVNITKESLTTETSKFTASSLEVSQTFSIREVMDPDTNQSISMKEAIERGILDQEKGVYRTGQSNIPITDAMNKGLITVESTMTSRSKEETKSVGLLTITVKSENRAYNVVRVRDPNSDRELSIEQAEKEGIYNTKKKTYTNPKTGDVMSVSDAIDSGALIVEFAEEDKNGQPELTEKKVTFAVYVVKDQNEGKRITFDEAVEREIIDQEKGTYKDTKTGDVISMAEALKRGYAKARVVKKDEEIHKMAAEKRLLWQKSRLSMSSYDEDDSSAKDVLQKAT